MLGVHCVGTLAPSAFLASAASTRDLQSHLLLNCHLAPNLHVESAIMSWTSAHNIPLLDNTSAIKQLVCDAPVIAADKGLLVVKPDGQPQ